ncbi:hypothetical protein [Prosthecobacter sp.]|uniref:hypothetical protein n=1 Tax=Prosthecobacter sp. TaxID=1965333 RepID=UPI002ABB579D|nr:hypothetical protein [Prosthecobacter sp.]MDZ4401128.1 hypothetical protein [Prosthecobacter sp.]
MTLPQDVQFLFIGLCILGGLFLIGLIRMFLLSRSNRRMRLESTKMEKQAVKQQVEITAIHHDAMSWRAKTQRQFDAFRIELSHRLMQSEQGNLHAQKLLDAAQEQSLASALAKITELEARLAAKPVVTMPAIAALSEAGVLPKPAGFIKPPPSSLPSLPAMETLRLQALENELAAARTEIVIGRQQNAALQRALLLARRRQPAARKNGARGTTRCA